MTTATQAQTVNAQVFLVVLAVAVLLAAYVGLRGLRHRVLDWWDRREERRAEDDVVLIDIAELDEWADAILADPLPENTQPIAAMAPESGLATVHDGESASAPEVEHESSHAAVEVWQPRVSPLEHYERATASLMRIPGYLPDPFHAQTYAGRAAMLAADLRDGRPVYDEDAYATHVLQGLSRPQAYVDAPVSPAPWMEPEHRPRHALGTAEGTKTQRHLWQQDTGAWPVVRELTGVGA